MDKKRGFPVSVQPLNDGGVPDRVTEAVIVGACAWSLILAATALLGWTLGDPGIIHLYSPARYGTTTPLTASGIALCAAALWLLRADGRMSSTRRAVAASLAAICVVISLLVLVEYISGWQLRVDRLLFPQTTGALMPVLPGRPAPAAGFSLVALGAALLSLDSRSRLLRRVSEVLLLLVIMLALERCVTFFYRETSLFAPRWRVFGRPLFQPLPPDAALAFATLAVGALYARSQREAGLLGLLHARGPTYLVTRRLIPAAIIIPIVVGWLGMVAWRAGMRGTVYPLSLVVSSMIVLQLMVILLNARAIKRTDTERMHAEAELAERERLLEAVFDNAGPGILLVGLDGRAVTANQALLRLTGYATVELTSLPFWDLLAFDDAAEHRRLFGELVEGKRERYSLETRCGRKDNAELWVMLHTSVARDASGRPELIIVTLDDVTERKRAELAQSRLAAILEATPDFVAVADPDRHAIRMNHAGCELTGYSQDEITRLKVEDFHPAATAQLLLHEALPTAIREGYWSGETELKTRDGTLIPVSQVILAHKQPNGEVAYFSTVMRDITHRKRLEVAQQFLLDVSRAASRSTDTGTILRSLVGLVVPRHADYCVIHLLAPNGTIEQAAFARPARTGQITETLRVYPNARKPNRLIEEVARSGKATIIPAVTDADLTLLLRGARHVTLLRKLGIRSIMALPLRGRERVFGVICYIRTDATKPYTGHRVALAEEMATRVALLLDNAELLRQARDATQTRDEVLGVVAHDLRNPLNTVSLATDYLREVRVPPGSAAWADKLDMITRAVAQADDLIEDLLDVARMEAGKLTMDMRKVEINGLIHEVIRMHQPLADEKGVRLRSIIPGYLGSVQADFSRLVQVFSNLIGNAIKFSPVGSNIVLDAHRHDGSIRFCVRDQGTGISEEDQQSLFNPFWQARRTRAGAGLGLAIAKAIVQAHGGRIWVESRPGTGSTFYFTIPGVPGHAAAASAAD